MKSTLFTTLAVLSAASVLSAAPFTVRLLPAGFDTADDSGSFAPIPSPIAADFLGNGRLQWYAGGNVITRFPEAGVITLPAITLPQTPAATVRPLAGAVCDANHDGRMDIVRINEWNGHSFLYTLQVFLNNGSGGFTAGYRLDWTDKPAWTEGRHYFGIVPADYDNEGGVDLAILEVYQNLDTSTDPDQQRGRLLIRWNDGTGGFADATTVQSNRLSNATRISAADFDRDGDTDLYCSLATTYGPDPINPFGVHDTFSRSFLYTNLGGRSLQQAGGLFADTRPVRMEDVNGDGWADLVGIYTGGNQARNISFNNGDGTFGPVQDGSSPFAIHEHDVFADMTGDSRPEWISSTEDSLEIRVGHSVNSNGEFAISLGTVAPDATLPARVTRMAAADSDGDGDTDIFASLEGGGFAFIENTQLHTFPGATLAGSVGLNGITSLKSGDLDRDSQDDVLAVNPAGEKLWIIATNDTGAPGTVFPKGTASEAPHSAAVADFNHDGQLDVAYTLPAAGTVRLAVNSGGAFSGWTDTAIATSLTGVSLLATGEYGTPDGWPDLFTCSGTTGQIRGLYQTGATWGGQNIFSPISPVPQSLSVGRYPGGAGDEPAFLSSNGSSLNLRAAQFSPPWGALGGTGRAETVTGGPHAAKVVWGDANGDARPEAVFVNGDGALAAWNPAMGAHILSAVNIGAAPASPVRDLASVDWDQDGRDDVLVATDAGLSVFHHRRALNSWVQSDLYSPSTGGYTVITVLNLNGDRYPDAVALHPAGRLDYIINQPYGMRADLSANPAVEIAEGSSAIAVRLPMTTNGHPAANGSPGDPNATVIGCRVEFLAAVRNGPNWTPAASYFESIHEVISGVTLEANGFTAGSLSNAGISGGRASVYYRAGQHTLSPVAPGIPALPHGLRLHVSPNAPQLDAPFFVRVTSVHWVHQGAAFTIQEGVPVFLPGEQAQIINHEPVQVTIVPGTLTPLQQWRQTNFGTPNDNGTAANDADPDGDTVPNLAEYFHGTNPNLGEGPLNDFFGLTQLPIATRTSPVNLRLFSSTAALTDPKLLVRVQYSTGQLDSWLNLSTYTGGGTWTGVVPTVLPPAAGRSNVSFATSITPLTTPKFFVRLKLEELP